MARECITVAQVVFHGLIWTSAYLIVGIMMAFPLIHQAVGMFFA
jgi:hypothetical protein